MQSVYPLKPADVPESGRFNDFGQFSSYLDGLGLFRMHPGLERMEAMLAHMGLKRPPFAVVQVAGTNGKGSTCAMLERLAREHGLRTGIHTSPHFVSVRERVRLNGKMLSETAWVALANKIMQMGGEKLSYFEFVTCLAVLAFAEADADIAVMETGLGGSFDATSALEADLVLFTPFGLDHQTVLGPTLRDIAMDKAGAIRSGTPVISVRQQAEAAQELSHAALQRSAPLTFIDEACALPGAFDTERYPMRLTGNYQTWNARLALAGWQCLRNKKLLGERAEAAILSAKAKIRERDMEAAALAKAWLPGRIQYIPPISPAGRDERSPAPLGWPPILLDGAHNGHGLAALGLALAREGIAPAAVIFSCLADKDLDHVLPHLRSLATGPIFIPPIAGNPRAMPPQELAALAGSGAAPAGSLFEALQMASAHIATRLPEAFSGERPKNPLLICGSLYLLGEFFSLRPDCLELY